MMILKKNPPESIISLQNRNFLKCLLTKEFKALKDQINWLFLVAEMLLFNLKEIWWIWKTKAFYFVSKSRLNIKTKRCVKL